VTIEALKERYSLSDLAERFEIHPTQITKWKKDFLENAASVFDTGSKKEEEDIVDVDRLYSKIGQPEIERDFLKKTLKKIGLL
jgi:transposase